MTADYLPGLEPPTRPVSPIEDGVRRTLADLDARGLLSERDAARTALAVTMAQIVSLKHSSGRMSTVGHDARVLMDLLDGLVPADSTVDDDLREVLEAWSDD